MADKKPILKPCRYCGIPVWTKSKKPVCYVCILLYHPKFGKWKK